MEFLLPTGQRVRVDGNERGYLGAWGCMAWVRAPRDQRRIHTGVVGSTRAALEEDGSLGRLRSRSVSFAGGTLEAFEQRREDRTTLVWSGRFWEVSSYVQARNVALARYTDFLSGFELVDDPAGLVLRPKGGLQITVDRVLAANNVPEACAVVIERGHEAAVKVPRWRGRAVHGGELWRDSYRTNSTTLPMALLANASSVTSLYASTVGGAADRMAELASGLQVTIGTA